MEYYNEARLKNDPAVNGGRPYRQCTLSVMDTIADPDIRFDENGVCHYYQEYLKQESEMVFTGAEAERRLAAMVENIQVAGKGKRYDCITGVSGGVDSTYLALQAKKLGLRPLIVHFDNGWNSELAVQNIQNIISRLGFDLYTLVVDWNEFRDIQLSYFRANVVDIEAVTDHAIIATMYKLAIDNDIKYVLSGANVVTEAILPRSWIFNKTDHRNLEDIHKKYGTVSLKTFPLYKTAMKKKVQFRGIQSLKPLNLMSYNKKLVKETIIKELGWRDYGGKHYESVFTRFYQGYILPAKFHIDKRKAHLSNLVFSGQIRKNEALEELSKPIYDAEQLSADFDFVMKKLGFTHAKFEEYIRAPRREHSEFRVEKGIFEEYPVLAPLKPVRNMLASLKRK